MKKVILNSILLLSSALLFQACNKTDIKEGGGKTLIKIVGGGTTPIVFPLDTDPQVEEIQLFVINRDAASEAELNQPTTITITNTQAHLDAYNDENGTSFELPPASAYTITSESGVTVSGDTWTLNFAAGEFSRPIRVEFDKSQLDLAKSYAFGLQVTQATVGTPSMGNGMAVINVLIKNKYDGEYEVTGTMADAGAALDGYFPMTYHLITSGERIVDGFDPVEWEDYFIPIYSGPDVSGYGSFSPVFTFDANDNIISVTNIYGQPAGNGRYAALDPSGINKYDPVTGDIDVKFFMFQPSSVPLPNPRVSFDWHMEYLGPR